MEEAKRRGAKFAHSSWSLALAGLVVVVAANTMNGVAILFGLLAGVLLLASFILGIVGLASSARRSGSSLAGGIVGISASVLVALGAVMAVGVRELRKPAAPQPLTPDSSQELREITDNAYRFTLKWPGKAWKLLPREAATGVLPDALAGMTGGKDLWGVVVVERVGDLTTERFAQLSFEAMQYDKIEGEKRTKIIFAGKSAIQSNVRVIHRGTKLGLRIVYFMHQSHGYKLFGWGTSKSMGPAGASLEPFFSAFHLLPGKVVTQTTMRKAHDQSGAGWRVRKNVYENAYWGLRVTPAKGWRLILNEELKTHNDEAIVGLASNAPAMSVIVMSERISAKASRAALVAFYQQSILASEGMAPDGESTLRIAGQRVSAKRYRMSEHDLLHAIVFVSGVAYQVLITSLQSARSQVHEQLPAGLASLSIIPEKDLMPLRQKLAKSFLDVDLVDHGFALRHGVYTDFDHRFSLTLPAGHWEAVVGKQSTSFASLSRICFFDQVAGLSGLVLSAPLNPAEQKSKDATRLFYRRVLSHRFTTTVPKSTPSSTKLGDFIALSDTFERNQVGERSMEHIVAWVDKGYGRALVVLGPKTLYKRFVGRLAGLKAALRPLAVTTRAHSRKGNVFTDNQLGFRAKGPDPSWRLRKSVGQKTLAINRTLRWDKSAERFEVFAVIVSEDQSRVMWGVLEQKLIEGLSKGALGKPKRSMTKVAGLTARRITAHTLTEQREAYLMRRGHTFFGLMTRTKHWGTKPDVLLKGFELL
ncbi:MAG: hypothetical protein JRH20_14090 [Deltaproteobacteria bacterium]|nr:hypothetical protein [Deltaproteobacteria bacterium]